MAFSKKTWKDRVSQYINRRLLTDSDGNTQQVTVTRDEGSVTEAGDAFSAANMNDLEDRIDNAFDGLTASDIPYSAGVSVADILDSLTTPTLVTQTSYSGITDNTEIYKITDKIYVISINITNPTATSSWVNICDFSAPSFTNQCFTAVSTETNDSTYCQCFYTSGKARLRISAPKASTYRGFMMLVIP